jgi:cytidylate kinase
MTVITISREFGNVGDDLGERIAQRLGYHFVDKEFVGAVLSEYGLIDFNSEFETLPGFWERFDAQRGKHRDLMVSVLNQVVQAVARHGDVVIRGRSGFAILGGFADVLHVRLQAPLSVRVEHVMAQRQMTAEQAAASVKDGDEVRRSFVEEFYGVPWDAIQAFDLVINTGKILPDLAMTWVIDAAKRLALSPATGKPTTSSIEVDSVLAKAVADELRCQTAHSQ